MTLQQRLQEVFGIDLRTLALFRILLGTVILVTLVLRLPDLQAFYTDSGVLPRHWLIQADSPWRWSLHMLNGGAWFQAVLFAVAILAALAMVVGYRTRWATFLTWLLLVSVNSRNPLVMIGGDTLMTCLMFWAMFLPLGARASVDAALSPTPPPAGPVHYSIASAALLLQVMSVYFFSAIFKTDPAWENGPAVFYALSLESYATPLGVWLRQFPALLSPLSSFVWWLEMLGPVLIFTPVFTRAIRLTLLILFVGMHLGFFLCLEIGHYPFVSWASLSTFVGTGVWDWLARRHDQRHPGRMRIYYDKDCGFCHKTALLIRTFLGVRADILPAQDTPRARALLEANYSWVVMDIDDQAYLKWPAMVALFRRSFAFSWLWPVLRSERWVKPGNAVYDWVGRHRGGFGRLTAVLLPFREYRFSFGGIQKAAVAIALVFVMLWNFGTVGITPAVVVNAVKPPLMMLRLDQFWDMFAPRPMTDDGWYVIPGMLENGEQVDLVRPGQPLSYEMPERVSGEYPNVRWHVWGIWNYTQRFRDYRPYWARYLCREWNREAEEGRRLTSLKIIYMLKRVPLYGQPPSTVEQRVLWRHDCTGGASPAAEAP